MARRHLLHHERISMLWYQWLKAGGRTIEVACGHSAVFQRLRREQVLRVSMFLDKALQHGPQNLSPNFTNSVDTPIPGIVKSLICRGVDGVVLHEKRDRNAAQGGRKGENTKE